jgi:hypothetical protein
MPPGCIVRAAFSFAHFGSRAAVPERFCFPEMKKPYLIALLLSAALLATSGANLVLGGRNTFRGL